MSHGYYPAIGFHRVDIHCSCYIHSVGANWWSDLHCRSKYFCTKGWFPPFYSRIYTKLTNGSQAGQLVRRRNEEGEFEASSFEVNRGWGYHSVRAVGRRRHDGSRRSPDSELYVRVLVHAGQRREWVMLGRGYTVRESRVFIHGSRHCASNYRNYGEYSLAAYSRATTCIAHDARTAVGGGGTATATDEHWTATHEDGRTRANCGVCMTQTDDSLSMYTSILGTVGTTTNPTNIFLTW